jgi:hypothetical protein
MADDPVPHHGSERRIDSVFRNGSMTVVGVLAAFSLGILTEWTTGDGRPWKVADLAIVIPMVVGIAAQLLALKRLLHPDSLNMTCYARAIRLFLWGLGLLAAGVMVGVIADGLSAL